MAVRNMNWYDLNSARDYPLDAVATCVADDGRRLPSHFLADLYLKFPSTAANYAYLGAITVTSQIVTVVILGAQSLTDPRPIPLASVSIPGPVDAWRQYPVEALYPGVGGWIVFGHGVEDVQRFSARFSTAQQSFFTPRAAKAYDPLPVTDLGNLNQDPALTGLIMLLGGNDIEIVGECRTIPGYPANAWETCEDLLHNTPGRPCIVIRLKNTSTNSAQARNVFAVYASPCLNTPESETCGDPPPIEFIGPVQPDCCGNITIKFRGCATVSAITASATINPDGSQTVVPTDNGVVIDCGLGMLQSCVTADNLPDEHGKLPNQYDDLCSSLSVLPAISLSETLYTPAWSFSFSFDSIDDVPEISLSISFSENTSEGEVSIVERITTIGEHNLIYDDSFLTADAWQALIGYFALAPTVMSTVGHAYSTHFADSAAGTNLAVCQEPDTAHFKHRKVSAILSVDQGTVGSAHNAALLSAIRFASPDSSEYTALAAEIDWDAFREGEKLFRIARFNGSSWFTLASIPVPNLSLGLLYRVSLIIYPHGEDDVWVIAELNGVGTLDDSMRILGPIAVADVGADDGTTYSGLHTKQSRANFFWFGVETR